MQKYIVLTEGFHLPDGRFVNRIQAIRDFGSVVKGTLGGFVERCDNLSHLGLCWIADDAVAAGWSRVTGDAQLKNRAFLDQHATAGDRAVLSDDVLCDRYVAVYGDCRIGAFSYLSDGVEVRDFASVFCKSRYGNSKKRVPNLRDRVVVSGHASLAGAILLCDDSTATEHATLKDSVRMKEKSFAGGFAVLQNRAYLHGNAKALDHTTAGGRTELGGNVVATGHCVLLGKTKLLANVRVTGSARLENVCLSGDQIVRC